MPRVRRRAPAKEAENDTRLGNLLLTGLFFACVFLTVSILH
jgi:hypothetical protein